MLGDLFGFIFAALCSGIFFSLVVNGFRTGRIRHTTFTSAFSRHQQPVQFYLVVLLFVLFAGMFLCFAFVRALAVWHHFIA